MRKFNHYSVAYKRTDEEEYKIVSNPPYGWAADPFLVEFRGEIYLFAELFLCTSERKGVIGYCKYNGKCFGDWEVAMDKHWHLSYPNVFVENDELYMCPESYQSEEVAVYKLLKFPREWEKVYTVINNVEYCDSTFLKTNDKKYMFTYERIGSFKQGKGLLFEIGDNGVKDILWMSENSIGNRPAGNILFKDGKYIRVAQYSKEEYGQGLVFFQVDALAPNYSEHEIKRIMPQDIKVNFKKKIVGVHTYNRLNDLEVIDIKYREFSLKEFFAQKRVRKVFFNKF